MKKSKNYVGIVAAVFVIAMIALVWYLLFGADFIRRAQKSDGQEEKQEETTEKEELLNISNVDQAYDAILNKSTKEFIGNHPIDEEFLSWFTGNYRAVGKDRFLCPVGRWRDLVRHHREQYPCFVV